MNIYDNEWRELLHKPPLGLKNESGKDTNHRKELENKRQYLRGFDTWGRIDLELIRDHLNDAPIRLENDNWKLRMNNLKWWTPDNQTKKTLELLRIGENNSHYQKQLWEDDIKLEPWILKRMEQDLRETLLQSSKLRMTTRSTTMNYLDTLEWRKEERLSQRWKEFERSWRKTYDRWWIILTSNLKWI